MSALSCLGELRYWHIMKLWRICWRMSPGFRLDSFLFYTTLKSPPKLTIPIFLFFFKYCSIYSKWFICADHYYIFLNSYVLVIISDDLSIWHNHWRTCHSQSLELDVPLAGRSNYTLTLPITLLLNITPPIWSTEVELD